MEKYRNGSAAKAADVQNTHTFFLCSIHFILEQKQLENEEEEEKKTPQIT